MRHHRFISFAGYLVFFYLSWTFLWVHGLYPWANRTLGDATLLSASVSIAVQDRRSCAHRKTARQRAETTECSLLLQGQELITPGDRRIDRLLTFGEIARAGGREESVVRQAVQQILDG
jgi:hypothetical protein